MSVFYRDIDVNISNYKSELSKPLIVYERDRGLEIYFNLIEYAYRFDKNPRNLLQNLVGAYATVTLVNPSGDEIRVNEVEITEEAKVKFVITEDLTDELTEIGIYQLQIHVNNDVEGKDTSVFSVPPFNFEVRERIKGKKNELLDSEGNKLTDEGGYQLVSATSNKVINFSASQINKYLSSIPTIQGEIKDFNLQLDTKTDYEYVNNQISIAQLEGATIDTSSFITRSDLDKVLIKSINKFNPKNLTKDKYLTRGVLTDYVGWCTTDYIRIQGTTMSCKVFKTSDMDYVQGDANKWVEVNNIYYAFYDSSYQYIPSSGSADTGDRLNQVSIPDNAKFIRFSQSNKLLNDKSTLVFAFGDLSGLTTINDYKKYCVELDSSDYLKKEELNQNINNIKNTLSRSVTVKSINRLGFDVYNPNTPPEHSLDGYKLALEKGFDEILCDLRSTSDSVPVCLHDATINRTARNADGSNIATKNILDITYNEANSYDYGLYKNKKYKGTKLLTLERAVKFAKMNGVTLHIETKCGASEAELRMIENAVMTVKRYNMSKFVDWSADQWNIAVLQKIISLDKYANVATMPDKMTNERFNELLNLKTGFNRVFWFAWDTSTIDDDMLNRFIDNEVGLEIGTLNDCNEMKKLFDGNLRYLTAISSDKLVARECLK